MSDEEIQKLLLSIIDNGFTEATDNSSNFRKFLGYDYKELTSTEENIVAFAKKYMSFWYIKLDDICIYLKKHGYNDAEKVYKKMIKRTSDLLKSELRDKKENFKKKIFVDKAKLIVLEELNK